jgi:hypothetical protein
MSSLAQGVLTPKLRPRITPEKIVGSEGKWTAWGMPVERKRYRKQQQEGPKKPAIERGLARPKALDSGESGPVPDGEPLD